MSIIKPLGIQKIEILKTEKTLILNPEELVYYAVNQNETLISISKKNGINASYLQRLNGLKDDKIYPGQVLYIKRPLERPKKVNNIKNLKPFENNISSDKNKEVKLPSLMLDQNVSKEWEEYQFRETTCTFLGFTENIKINDPKLNIEIDHCLTGVTLVLDHQAFSPDGINTLPKIPRKNWTHFYTLYFNGDGRLVKGELNLYVYTTQVQNVGSGSYSNENKIISPIDMKNSKMISTHDDLFLKDIIEFENGDIFEMKNKDNQTFKKTLEAISIFNRRAGMNFIYAEIKKEKEKVAKTLAIANLIALPFDIPKIQQLQKMIGVIFYLIGLEQLAESFTEDDSKLKGPIMLSPIFYYDYEIKDSGNGYKKQIQTGFETLDSYKLWESYESIGLIKK
ncbi:LysM peptidoglycan-binding domain-containing protein [Chryseobacterium sp. CT-SW4]|uniref:LysM peptidoglycan-binding domain-containing protein n=1 Tax=Chryseobacterium sp. SW-1 TaxID=3157343 RepID=UPI003B015C34